jgi:hypothetical protein
LAPLPTVKPTRTSARAPITVSSFRTTVSP